MSYQTSDLTNNREALLKWWEEECKRINEEDRLKAEKFDNESVIFEDENSKISLKYEYKYNETYKPADEEGNYDENSESINMFDPYIKPTWSAELIEKHGKHIFTFEDKQKGATVRLGIDNVASSKRHCYVEVPVYYDDDGFSHPILDNGENDVKPNITYSDKLNFKSNAKNYTAEVNGEETDISNDKDMVRRLKSLLTQYIDSYYVDTIEKTNPFEEKFYKRRHTGQEVVEFMNEKREEELAKQREAEERAQARERAEANREAFRKQQMKEKKAAHSRVTSYITTFLAKREIG